MSGTRKIIAAVLSAIFIFVGFAVIGMNQKFTSKDRVELIFALPPGAATVAAAKRFQELCAQYSDGRIVVDLFTDNILGDDKTVVEGAQTGDIDIAMSSTSPIATMYHDYYIFDAPYLFLSTDEVYQVGFKGEAGRNIREGVSEIGLKGLSFWENGFRNLTNSGRAVTAPADLTGMKIRTMENRIHMAAWKALGANPTPMAFSEVFTALQQKTIDGQENPLGLIDTNKFYEVNSFISLSQHVYTPYCVVMNLDKWNSLTEEQKEIVQRAMDEAADFQIAMSQEKEGVIIEMLKQNGNTVVNISPEEKKAFQDIIVGAGVHDMVRSAMEHKEYFDQMKENLEAYRNGGV